MWTYEVAKVNCEQCAVSIIASIHVHPLMDEIILAVYCEECKHVTQQLTTLEAVQMILFNRQVSEGKVDVKDLPYDPHHKPS